MSRYAAKVDQNQPEIVKALRRAGAHVELLHRVGQGCPDLDVTFKSLRTYMEVKMPGEKLNDDQQAWHLAYFVKTGFKVPVVHTEREALEAIGVDPTRVIAAVECAQAAPSQVNTIRKSRRCRGVY